MHNSLINYYCHYYYYHRWLDKWFSYYPFLFFFSFCFLFFDFSYLQFMFMSILLWIIIKLNVKQVVLLTHSLTYLLSIAYPPNYYLHLFYHLNENLYLVVCLFIYTLTILLYFLNEKTWETVFFTREKKDFSLDILYLCLWWS